MQIMFQQRYQNLPLFFSVQGYKSQLQISSCFNNEVISYFLPA